VSTVFLTGATGFIGGRLAARLAASGARLRCLARNEARTAPLRALGAEIVPGDVTNQAVLETGLQGCDLAYHLAGIYDLGVVDDARMERINVGGTRAFLDAVAASGIARAVHVSTTVALGPAQNGERRAVRETEGPHPSAYHRTKAEAHKLARLAQERGQPIIIACPAYVYGPGDEGPAGRFIADLLRRRIPGLVTQPAWFSFVHVDDIAAGLQRVGERGQTGATYVLAGEADTINGFAGRVAELGGVRAPLLRFPPALASLTGRLLDVVTQLTGWRFSISRESIAATARERWLHSDERARQELDWTPRSLADGLPGTVTWFQKREPSS
jgi:dihydroflavonol-4-reductase